MTALCKSSNRAMDMLVMFLLPIVVGCSHGYDSDDSSLDGSAPKQLVSINTDILRKLCPWQHLQLSMEWRMHALREREIKCFPCMVLDFSLISHAITPPAGSFR